MKPLTVIFAVASILIGGACLAQPVPGAPDSFDEVAIDVSSKADARLTIKYRGDLELKAVNKTLRELIGTAVGVQPTRVVGGPEWLDTTTYDVLGKSSIQLAEGLGRTETYRRMLRKALTDRFALVLREESRAIQVLTLVVDDPAKVGVAIQPGNAAAPAGMRRLAMTPNRITGVDVTVAFLASELERRLDRPVRDKTELAGAFNFALEIPTPPNAESIAAALKQQIGLRLDNNSAPGEVFVVESARPLSVGPSASVALAKSVPSPQSSNAAGSGAGLGRNTETYTGQRISVQIVDHPIREVTGMLEKISGLRILVSPKINDSVTFKANDVPWDQALSDLAVTQGWILRREEGVIYVDPQR